MVCIGADTDPVDRASVNALMTHRGQVTEEKNKDCCIQKGGDISFFTGKQQNEGFSNSFHTFVGQLDWVWSSLGQLDWVWFLLFHTVTSVVFVFQAFVEMKNPPDAQKLVDYYSSNTLRINNDFISVSFSGEYKSLM